MGSPSLTLSKFTDAFAIHLTIIMFQKVGYISFGTMHAMDSFTRKNLSIFYFDEVRRYIPFFLHNHIENLL